LGGTSSVNGQSNFNLFVWNPITERHESTTPFTQTLNQPHNDGDCTVIPADAKVLRGCTLGYVML